MHGTGPDPDRLPVPALILDGPYAARPCRGYVLYIGGLDDALALTRLEDHGQQMWTRTAVPDRW